MKKISLFLLFIIFLSAGCATKRSYYIFHKPVKPSKTYIGYQETGIASWYGSNFHGRPTASGEIYNMYAMTAAHKTLPLGTYVKVTNLENGRTVVVKINDRGPFVKGRIIDLTYTAAKKLGMANKGITRVKITVVKSPFLYTGKGFRYSRYYAAQIASFSIYSNAKSFKKFLAKYFNKTYIKSTYINNKKFYRVMIGNYSRRASAEKILKKALNLGYDGFIVEIDK
jgi:rare lipoprotein A